MEEKYIKFYKMFHKKFKNGKNLILCSKTLRYRGIELNGELNSSFELTFTLHHSNNDLIFETNRLTDRQTMLYEIISYLHNEQLFIYFENIIFKCPKKKIV